MAPITITPNDSEFGPILATSYAAALEGFFPKGIRLPPGDAATVPLNWKMRLPPGHFGLEPAVKKEATRLSGMIDLNCQRETGVLLHVRGGGRRIWVRDAARCLLVPSCSIVKVKGKVQPTPHLQVKAR